MKKERETRRAARSWPHLLAWQEDAGIHSSPLHPPSPTPPAPGTGTHVGQALATHSLFSCEGGSEQLSCLLDCESFAGLKSDLSCEVGQVATSRFGTTSSRAEGFEGSLQRLCWRMRVFLPTASRLLHAAAWSCSRRRFKRVRCET